jgi:hypothetical protein
MLLLLLPAVSVVAVIEFTHELPRMLQTYPNSGKARPAGCCCSATAAGHTQVLQCKHNSSSFQLVCM